MFTPDNMKCKEFFEKTVNVASCILMIFASLVFDTIIIGGLIVAPIYHFLLK